MATLRAVIEENIARAEALVAQYRGDLASFEQSGKNWLDREIGELRDEFANLATHLWSHSAEEAVAVQTPAVPDTIVAAPAADTVAAAVDTITAATGTDSGTVVAATGSDSITAA